LAGRSSAIPLFAFVTRECPPHDELQAGPIRAADFDRIAAELRQCWTFPRSASGAQNRRKHGDLPALLESGGELLPVKPAAVSPIEPVMRR
jgi:hypothetical protein